MTEAQEGAAAPTATPQSADDILIEVGRDYLRRGLYETSVADRSADLLSAATEWANDNGRAKIVMVEEPGTGEQGAVIIGPRGTVDALPETVFDAYREKPKRRKGTAKMDRADSFIAHTNRFKGETSALFASESAMTITAVLDYHAEEDRISDVAPNWCLHRAHFAFPLSPELKAWRAKDKQTMDNKAFAEFIEDRFVEIEHITDPSVLNDDVRKALGAIGEGSLGTPSEVFALSEGISSFKQVTIGSHTKLSNGRTQIMLREENPTTTNAKGEEIEVPRLFIVTIPIFADGDLYRIAVRLRWRDQGGISFTYEMWGIERVMKAAFDDVCADIVAKTDLPIFFGAPE